MILTPWFAIGHLPKTGGDATKQIVKALCYYGAIPSQGIFVDGVEDPCKHWTFRERVSVYIPRVLFLRRLPAWEVSHAYHLHLLGDAEHQRQPLATPEQIIAARWGETLLSEWLSDPEQPKMLQSENLLAELEMLFAPHATCRARLRRIIRSVRTKPPGAYDHAAPFFTDDQKATLYAVSPIWTAQEKALYGGLL